MHVQSNKRLDFQNLEKNIVMKNITLDKVEKEIVARVRNMSFDKFKKYFVSRIERKWKSMPRWEDLVEELPDELVPIIDRKNIDENTLTDYQKIFRDNGFLILEKFLPDNLIDAYCSVREKLNKPGGYSTPTPYLEIEEIKNLCTWKPLTEILEELIGEPMGMHLNLTGWVSTERNWHQDEYLNPPHVRGYYVAVWMALDDIHRDSGPFEYVPGSHKWALVRREKVQEYIEPKYRSDARWPKMSERFLTALFNEQVTKTKLLSAKFIAKKGDVLIWHSRLMHRGTVPINPNLQRKTIITHYSGIHHREDMPVIRQHKDGGYFFVPPPHA